MAVKPGPVQNTVFINCPFDNAYKPIFDALIFATLDLGFVARHALVDNSTPMRLDRIVTEIVNAEYSVHDISRIQTSGPASLPRFNMPFEAGIAYCAQKMSPIGHRHFLLLDATPYQYQASMSDVAGLDPKIHNDDPQDAINAIRHFLVTKSGIQNLPGAVHIGARHALFKANLPSLLPKIKVTQAEIDSFEYLNDLQFLMTEWMQLNPS